MLICYNDNDLMMIQMDDDDQNLLMLQYRWLFVLLFVYLGFVIVYLLFRKLVVQKKYKSVFYWIKGLFFLSEKLEMKNNMI